MRVRISGSFERDRKDYDCRDEFEGWAEVHLLPTFVSDWLDRLECWMDLVIRALLPAVLFATIAAYWAEHFGFFRN
jgi:hypothetical protein